MASPSSRSTIFAVVGAPTSAYMSASSRCSKASSSSDSNIVAWSSAPSAWRVLDMFSRRRLKKPPRWGSPASSSAGAGHVVDREQLLPGACHAAELRLRALRPARSTTSAAGTPVSLREMTLDTPSPPMLTPYRRSAASIVRFWWVTTMNWARSE